VWLLPAIFQRIAKPTQHRKLIKAPASQAASRLAIAGRQAVLSRNAKESEPQTQDCRPIKKSNPCTNPQSRPPCEIADDWHFSLTAVIKINNIKAQN
jgi:hypothetical protein